MSYTFLSINCYTIDQYSNNFIILAYFSFLPAHMVVSDGKECMLITTLTPTTTTTTTAITYNHHYYMHTSLRKKIKILVKKMAYSSFVR